MEIASIHQPPYLSWFGLLDKIIKSDIFIIMDDVQFNRRAFQHRTLYSNPSGKPSYLTLSVDAKNHQLDNLLINEVKVNNIEIIKKHYEIILNRYGKFKSFQKYKEEVEYIFNQKYTHLLEINLKILNFMLKVFSINTQIIYASEFNTQLIKSDRILDLVKASGCTTYLSGVGAKNYMNEEDFKNNNIQLNYQDFYHIQFDQKTKKDFQDGCFALELPFIHEDYMEQLYTHYENINQLNQLKSIKF
ncbi:MAG: hypothetical protein C0626_12695 [Arcobacter sp.]|uniref:WbqC family protein n=1 Tax=uncultured Arcobacter sp. TaxID=165434 RepID=UPI000CBBD211|nr:WbqC family protein [uncultured Arcobacter sp.]PLY08700.1 MAG: hypothetical protein C0626_12695 [Arcobacter sp.]